MTDTAEVLQMQKYTIEDNIPMPTNGAGRFSQYPFSQMNVGQSFLAQGSKKDLERVSACAYQYGAQHNMKFMCRKASPNSVRIWRKS